MAHDPTPATNPVRHYDAENDRSLVACSDALRQFLTSKIGIEDAEDLAQQIVLAHLERRDMFRGESSLKTYLFQAARFQLASYYRVRRVRPLVSLDHEPDAPFGSTLEERLEGERRRRLLRVALGGLPTRYRRILELNVCAGLSGEEIARSLAMSPSTVRNQIRLAIKCLRSQLKGFRAGAPHRGSDFAHGNPGSQRSRTATRSGLRTLSRYT